MSTIAYLVNQYPKVSHSFIRREVLSLEAHGLTVMRFSIRSCGGELVDEADKQELQKTKVILSQPVYTLLWGLFKVLLTRPAAFVSALGLAFGLGRQGDRGVLYHLIYLVEACTLAGWLLSGGVTHLHAHFGTNSATVALLASELTGIPYSFTVHGPEEFDRVGGIGLTQKIERAKFVVAISSFGRSQLYRWCGFEHWSKIKIVRCGVEQDYLSAPAYELPDAPQLVCVGRLSEQKGHLMLIEAAGRLAKDGVPFNLTLVGDGPLRSPIEQRIRELNLTENVTITGWASSEAVKNYIIQSKASVLPSFAEGLPVVIMESLALGRPVVSTYVAGIPELVEPGRCGWLVPPGGIEKLAEAITALLETPRETLDAMGKAGQARIQRYHNAATEALVLKELFSAQEIPQSISDPASSMSLQNSHQASI
ncbi:MAG: glycosyltransferase family 4 protein [Elainellaceae cyanobacterium]